jgi:hypothetical protein
MQQIQKEKYLNSLINQEYNLLNIENTINNIIKTYNINKVTLQNNKINLILGYYKNDNTLRSTEIDLCLKLNCTNQLFNKIIIINETMIDIPFIDKNDNRIIIINNNNRLTYKNFFNYANQYSSEDTINILINSDIVIGENFCLLYEKMQLNELYFLTRYDIDKYAQISLCNLLGCDTWIWKNRIDHDVGNYFLGKPYCDFKLSYEFYKIGYKIRNPSLDLKTYHLHNINIRNYDNSERIKGDKFLKIKYSKLDSEFSENDYIFIS